MTKKGQFVTYKIPITLADIVDELIEKPESTYNTRASFIEDAIRRHIEKTKQDIINEQKWKDHEEITNI